MEIAVAVKYAHTNLVARDWKRLATFYIAVLGCKPKPPERDLRGNWVDNLTGLKSAHIQGMHLLLPGYGSKGPTLEIFQYQSKKRRRLPLTDQLGFGHIAFAVEDVGKTLKKIEENGGGRVGKRISAQVEGVGRLDVVYARDPEGNIIEIQKWE
jgi:lactoylglutathione lyase